MSHPCDRAECAELSAALTDLRESIARDIEAHYTPLNGDVGPSDYDEGLHTAALLARGTCGFVDCLACANIARGNSNVTEYERAQWGWGNDLIRDGGNS